MKQKPILVVSATRSDKTINTMISKSLLTISQNNSVVDKQYKLKIHTKNKRGLPDVYNQYINKKTLKQHDIVLFVHDDVYIDDLGCFDKLYNSVFTYGNDVVGLAGATQAKIQKPALWHKMSNPQHHSGSVAHLDPQTELMYTTSFGPYPKRCLIMDGLFLAVNIKSAVESDWMFNTNFKFHHYDIASCLDANKKKLKLSTCNIHVVHQSPGLSYYHDKSFQESQDKFLQMYSS